MGYYLALARKRAELGDGAVVLFWSAVGVCPTFLRPNIVCSRLDVGFGFVHR